MSWTLGKNVSPAPFPSPALDRIMGAGDDTLRTCRHGDGQETVRCLRNSQMDTVFLGLQTRNLGISGREMTNPFTGEKSIAYVDDGATDDEFAAGESVLDGAGAAPPDPDGFRQLNLDGNRDLSVNFGRLGGQVNVNGGLNLEAMTFVYRIASAAGMLVQSTIDPSVIAVLSGQHHAGIDDRWPSNTPIDSPESLLKWAASEIEAGRIA